MAVDHLLGTLEVDLEQDVEPAGRIRPGRSVALAEELRPLEKAALFDHGVERLPGPRTRRRPRLRPALLSCVVYERLSHRRGVRSTKRAATVPLPAPPGAGEEEDQGFAMCVSRALL